MPPPKVPTRFTSPLSRNRASSPCVRSGISSMSSRSTVPPCARSRTPARSLDAPTTLPFRHPKSSVSSSVSGTSPHDTTTSGSARRRARMVKRPGEQGPARTRLSHHQGGSFHATHPIDLVPQPAEDGAVPNQQGKRVVRRGSGDRFSSARGSSTRIGHRFGKTDHCKPIATRRSQSPKMSAMRCVYSDLPPICRRRARSRRRPSPRLVRQTCSQKSLY